jgi:hypothetical protein
MTRRQAALIVVALIVAVGVLRGLPLLDMVVFGIALVPQALPAVVTIAVAGLEKLDQHERHERHGHGVFERTPVVPSWWTTPRSSSVISA